MSLARHNPTHDVMDHGLKGWRDIPTPKSRADGHEMDDIAPPGFDGHAVYEVKPVARQFPCQGITDLLGDFRRHLGIVRVL